MSLDLADLQREVAIWGHHNFPHESALACAVGVAEEHGELADALMALLELRVTGTVGRLAHAVLKSEQKIRGSAAVHAAQAQDAAGDIIVYLAHMFSLKGWDLAAAVEQCWTEVSDRDWIAFPGNGVDR